MKEILKALSIGLSLWLAAGTAAHAQTAEQTRQARKAYARGQSLFREGAYEAAKDSFEEAYGAVPNPVVLLGIAEAQQRLGQWADAEKTLVLYLEQRPDAPDRAQVEGQLEDIRSRPGTLELDSTPPGAVIVVDGADTGAITPAELTLEPGSHQLTLHGVNGVEKQGAVEVAIGGKHQLHVDLSPPPVEVAEAEEAVEQPAEEPSMEDSDKAARVRRAAWASVGVAAGGAVIGAMLGGFAIKQQKAFDDDPSASSADKGEKLAIFADVGFGIAVAGALTAIVLFTADRRQGEEDEMASGTVERRRASVTPVFGRRGAGLATEVRF